MKGLIVLMCALVAVQARSTAVSKSPAGAPAALGDNPWVVHLRIAVSTSGLLDTCAGSLIDSSWVLTAASCVTTVRFIWIRYGLINVVTPELVTENSIVRIGAGYDGSPAKNIALISVNRVVHPTANISPVSLIPVERNAVPESATFCGFTDDASAAVPGEVLNCSELELKSDEDVIIADVSTSVFDLGAPLVKDGVQVGVLAGSGDGESIFVRPGDFLEWIKQETGLDFSSVDAVVADADPTKVNFVE